MRGRTSLEATKNEEIQVREFREGKQQEGQILRTTEARRRNGTTGQENGDGKTMEATLQG